MTRSIFDVIQLSRLAGEDRPSDIDWRTVAGLLAEQFDTLAVRLADVPGLSDADHERVARAAVAIRQYHAACTELDDE